MRLGLLVLRMKVLYIFFMIHGLGFGDPHWDRDLGLGAAIPIASVVNSIELRMHINMLIRRIVRERLTVPRR